MSPFAGFCWIPVAFVWTQAPAPSPVQAEAWKLEVVHRKAPYLPLEGLVVRQDPSGIELRQVIRKPGRPTFIITVNIPEEQIERVELLDSEERGQLLRRLDQIQAERAKRFARLKLLDKPPPMGAEQIEPPQGLIKTDWPTDKPGTNRAWKSSGQRFNLLTTARVEIAELCALQLDQVFTAFERLLPPRQETGPVTIWVTSSVEEWRALCKARGRAVLNPAWCDPVTGEVGLATDLTRLDERMDKLRAAHGSRLQELQNRSDELRKAYGGKLPPELQKPFDLSLRSLRETAGANERVLRQERDRLFARMNHEVFHAYLARFVLRPGSGGVPPWLNEGLAQVFEAALVEAGDLRADNADPERIKRFRADIQSGIDLPLTDLLALPASQFHVTGAADEEKSRRAYLASWALCSWLVLEKGRLRLEDIDSITLPEGGKVDPLRQFEQVFGMSLVESQNQLRDIYRKGAPGQLKSIPNSPSGEAPQP